MQIQTLTTKQKIFNFPLVKIILALIVTMALVIIGQQIIGKLLGLTSLDRNYRNLIKGILVSVLALTGYILFFKYYEKRKVTELATNGLAKNLLIGILIGVVLQSLTILVIYATGSFNIVAVNPVSFIIIPLTVAFTAAILEEILIRGILFRVLEEKLGSYIALAISAIIFGALHLSNPGATLVSALCVSIEAGILLGAAFMYSRNLWFPISIHFAWNFMQSGIFGAITSGNEKAESLLVTKIEGSVWITGGEFGPEGSFQAIIFCSIASVLLVFLCYKENKIVKPYWQK